MIDTKKLINNIIKDKKSKSNFNFDDVVPLDRPLSEKLEHQREMSNIRNERNRFKYRLTEVEKRRNK